MCLIRGASAKRWMQDQLISLPLQVDKRTDEVLEKIIIQLQNPAAMGDDAWVLGVPGSSELGEETYLADFSPAYDFDTANTTFPFVADNWDSSFKGNQHVGSDWSDGFYGYDAIEDLMKAERGRFFFGRDGKAYFWNRAKLQIDVDVDDTWDNLHRSIRYSYGERIENEVIVKAYPRKITNSQVLWELDEIIKLSRGQEKVIRARYSESDSDTKVGGQNVTTANVDKDEEVTLSIEYFADRAEITVRNTDTNGGRKRRLRDLQLIGDKLTTYNTIEARKANGVSKATYGVREKQIDSKLIDSENFARSVAEYEVLRHKNPLGEVESIGWVNSDADRISRALSTQMGDRVRVIDTQTQHDGEYFVIGERHRWDRHPGAGYQTTFFLESASSLQVWVLGETGFSELGETTYLGL